MTTLFDEGYRDLAVDLSHEALAEKLRDLLYYDPDRDPSGRALPGPLSVLNWIPMGTDRCNGVT